MILLIIRAWPANGQPNAAFGPAMRTGQGDGPGGYAAGRGGQANTPGYQGTRTGDVSGQPSGMPIARGQPVGANGNVASPSPASAAPEADKPVPTVTRDCLPAAQVGRAPCSVAGKGQPGGGNANNGYPASSTGTVARKTPMAAATRWDARGRPHQAPASANRNGQTGASQDVAWRGSPGTASAVGPGETGAGGPTAGNNTSGGQPGGNAGNSGDQGASNPLERLAATHEV